MRSEWDAEAGEWRFETETLRGIFTADSSGQPSLCNHRLRQFVHTPTGTHISADGSGSPLEAFGFSLFRAHSRDAYLTELRATPPAVSRLDLGVQLVWTPTLRHQARVTAAFTMAEPSAIDLDLHVEGYAFYPDYQILLANYLAPGFSSGVYVRRDDFSDASPEQIRVTDHPAFHGMYSFFPRDEHGAHLLTDGRGQRGRWYWRTAIGRLYALPMCFYSQGDVDVMLMGRAEDVSAVGVTYLGDDLHDGVAAHHGQYLSLFGRDLHPGEGWRTQARLVVDAFASDIPRHLSAYDTFLQPVRDLPRTFEVGP